jgi:hypothetical protein
MGKQSYKEKSLNYGKPAWQISSRKNKLNKVMAERNVEARAYFLSSGL